MITNRRPAPTTPDLISLDAWRRDGRDLGRRSERLTGTDPCPLRDILRATLARAARQHRQHVADQLTALDQKRVQARARVAVTRRAAIDNPRIEEAIGPMLAHTRALDAQRLQLHQLLQSGLDELLEAAAQCDAAWRLGFEEEQHQATLAPTPLTVTPMLYADILDPLT